MFPAYQAHHWWWCSTRRNIRWIVDVEILLSFGFVWFIHPPSQLIHPGSCPKNVDFADGQSHRTLTSVRPLISRYFFQHHLFFGGSICEKTTSPFLDPQIKKSDTSDCRVYCCTDGGHLDLWRIIPPCCWKITHHVSCWSWVKKNERPRPWLQVRKRFLFRRRYVSWNKTVLPTDLWAPLFVTNLNCILKPEKQPRPFHHSSASARIPSSRKTSKPSRRRDICLGNLLMMTAALLIPTL